MPTIDELKRDNERLKNQLKAREELIKIGEERNKLLKQNKQLTFLTKHPNLVSFGNVSSKTGKVVGKVAVKVGKQAGTSFMKWARKIAEAERREELLKKRVQHPRKGGK